MPDATVAALQAWLKDHESDLLNDTLTMLKFASIEGDPAPNAPFGPENRQALDFGLSICAKHGMKTTDLEGYLGYAEFGEGKNMIISLGHLDVVPVGPGWKHQPFGAEIDEGYIYSRGAVDDKGPTMASLYAILALKAVCPDLKVRVRQAFGCNEESGFKCVERYVKTEEAPTFGVAPDSGWPLYHAEKGIADFEITVPLYKGDVELLEVTGGQRPNIVIDSCKARLRVFPAAKKEVDGKLGDHWDKNLTFAWNGDVLEIEAHGKAAHGSTPFNGDSAAIRVFRFLKQIAPLSASSYFEELFETSDFGGSGIGIHGADEPSKNLTSNLGIVTTEGANLTLLYNIRYPVTWTGAELQAKCRKHLATLTSGFTLSVARDSAPLYFPLDHPLVKTVCDVYEEETGIRRAPGTMGGGTYARAIPNTVSIGTGWDGDGHAHETDERLKVEHLYKMSRIYVHILYRLAKLAETSA